MSSVARWSYQNTATVYPFIGQDDAGGGAQYDTPYTIACTWTAGGGEMRSDAEGREFVCKSTLWTEDQRPKFRDQIEMSGSFGRETIRAIKHYDMSALGEPDSPDFELATG